MELEIHHYDKRLESIDRRIAESTIISAQNRKLIKKFKDDCFAHNISAARIVRYLYTLRDMCIWLDKNLQDCTSDDLKDLVARIEQMSKYSPRTKYEYRSTLKKFYKWLKNKKDPKEVEWINLNFKKHNDKLPSELLTEEDILAMVNHTKNPRDRAMIICLYESGCRIGEFLKVKLKDLVFEKPGCVFIVNGKTGGRRIRVISSEPYLLDWLNKHPDKDNPDAFLWVESHSTDMLEYPAFCKAIRKSAERAKIRKKVNPHNFRHTRATYLASRFTEQQLKVFFGWTRASEMAAVYVHLSGKDVDNALLTVYGLKEAPKLVTELKPLVCQRCETNNEATNKFCKLCGMILNEEEKTQAIIHQSMKSEIDKVMDILVRDKEVAALLIQKIKEVKL